MSSVPPDEVPGDSSVPPGYEQPEVYYQPYGQGDTGAPPSKSELPAEVENALPSPDAQFAPAAGAGQYQQGFSQQAPNQQTQYQQAPYPQNAQSAYVLDPFMAYPLSTYKGGNPYGGPIYPEGSRERFSQPYYGANPGEAIKRFFGKYATFAGRASLSEFWWAVLFIWIAYFVFIVLIAFGAEGMGGSSRVVSTIAALVMSVFTLGIIVPSIALSVRRLHDADMSGGMYFLNFIPYLGSFIVLILNALPSKPSGARFDPLVRPVGLYAPQQYPTTQYPNQQYPGQF